ncbi:Hypothetical protein PFCIRM119_04815 [Propionibacterium freudenreichii]|uniref:Uncharacterized protein n=1 Tax=Propionibacterium freudenreichii subsp. shermanii (strain ATCC 9614 / DSM 4902 / CIP 103027 / NCIMB 8099 / CIRM-BIA1) TaxID=754252 RepID=D7GF85_PROFC|nr:Hypothetical protein PFREUD_16850 [Propionibacterium freudenreichii subsp. shermanii CIRM-BIA1]CDP48928.1 Hypothetical protein PFCIRM129_05835 [Propionibacterium freudenreichii subsp. freudenreichii]CEG86131.1 Hypothetical protein PFCIRM118_04800 [Propionibacterium freudenreichii]CEG87907.1 Hypothetical protein PFCIRM119_04815 [Propionibacterium freudenreichii]CEG98398.1 Hypothetical protein PFCIRM127_05175 [Propionibacterium freudenreichii]
MFPIWCAEQAETDAGQQGQELALNRSSAFVARSAVRAFLSGGGEEDRENNIGTHGFLWSGSGLVLPRRPHRADGTSPRHVNDSSQWHARLRRTRGPQSLLSRLGDQVTFDSDNLVTQRL